MTQETPNNAVVVVDEFEIRARAILSQPDYDRLRAYMDSGKHALASSTSVSMFELFLNGSDVREIHNINKAIPYESILWARIRDKWDAQRDEHIHNLQAGIRDRVLKAQLEAAGLMSDLVSVANKQYGAKIRRYFQNGDEKELAGVPKLESLQMLIKAVEGLQKVTGQDKTFNVKKEETLNLNVTTGSAPGDDRLSPEGAAQILSILAGERRKKIAGGDSDGKDK